MVVGSFEWKLQSDGRILPPISVPPTQATPQATLAGFLWALLGHPDKHVRWRALHAAHMLLQAPSAALVAELAELSRSRSAAGFYSPSLDFYWMSACAWVLVLFLRLAHEHPALISEQIDVLGQHATAADLPHAQIRELARRAVMQVAAARPGTVSLDVLNRIQTANTPAICLFPGEGPYGRALRGADPTPEIDRPERYRFWMDTERYWFSRLARVFEMREEDVTRRAEHWIVDEWGRTTDDWWHDQRELSGRYERREIFHSQGSIPDVEPLRTYLEYHAMCCAAGELVDRLPVAKAPYAWDDVDAWDEWLADHLPFATSHWLADLRGPTPNRADCWGQFPEVQEWLKRIEDVEYDEALELAQLTYSANFVVRGHHDVGDEHRRGSVRISSALVPCPVG